MIDRVYPDHYIVDLQGLTGFNIVIGDLCAKLVHGYGETRLAHLKSQRFLKVATVVEAPIQIEVVPGGESRTEEWKSLNMIPMIMRKKNMTSYASAVFEPLQ
jgi:hypothetical protein